MAYNNAVHKNDGVSMIPLKNFKMLKSDSSKLSSRNMKFRDTFKIQTSKIKHIDKKNEDLSLKNKVSNNFFEKKLASSNYAEQKRNEKFDNESNDEISESNVSELYDDTQQYQNNQIDDMNDMDATLDLLYKIMATGVGNLSEDTKQRLEDVHQQLVSGNISKAMELLENVIKDVLADNTILSAEKSNKTDANLLELLEKLKAEVIENPQGELKSEDKTVLRHMDNMKDYLSVQNQTSSQMSTQTQNQTSNSEQSFDGEKNFEGNISVQERNFEHLNSISETKFDHKINMMDRIETAKNIMNQIIEGTKAKLTNLHGTQNLTLKLKPQELGHVDLKISVEKGILMAEFQVESQIVKETLESNMADLKQALQQKGYGVEGLEVSVSQQNNKQSKKEMFDGRDNRRYFFADDDEVIDFDGVNKTLMSLQSTFEYLG